MTNLELVLNMLAEATTTELSKKEDPKEFKQSKKIAKKGGEIAGNTRKDIEKELGKPIVTKKGSNEIQFEEVKKMKNRKSWTPTKQNYNVL